MREENIVWIASLLVSCQNSTGPLPAEHLYQLWKSLPCLLSTPNRSQGCRGIQNTPNIKATNPLRRPILYHSGPCWAVAVHAMLSCIWVPPDLSHLNNAVTAPPHLLSSCTSLPNTQGLPTASKHELQSNPPTAEESSTHSQVCSQSLHGASDTWAGRKSRLPQKQMVCKTRICSPPLKFIPEWKKKKKIYPWVVNN